MQSIQEEIDKALAVLRSGGIILYPTDTVWGIGCDATNAEAVARIYALKRRDDSKSMIVLAADEEMVERYVGIEVPEAAWQLWEVSDKPLTLILDGAEGLAPNLLPAESTVAFRVVHHEFCERLVRALGRPLVSTSANLSGEPTPATFSTIAPAIKEGVDWVASPDFEGTATGCPSSIIRLGAGGQIAIVRE